MARKTSKRKKSPQPTTIPAPVTRRDAMSRLMWIGAGGVVVAGVGTAFAMDFRNKLAEADLSRIGQGIPVIVQIHDPQCGLCRNLQREARAALNQFDRDDVTYLVANIKSQDGAAFQARMGLPHVTLVLFDGAGNRVHTVQGVTPREELAATFRQRLNL